MYKITKQFSFSASHVLSGLATDHPCSRLHGHNYCVELVLEGSEVDCVGFIRDYRDLTAVKKWIDDVLDHKHLNDVTQFNPTAENLAKYIFDQWSATYKELVAVRVSETPKTWAEYQKC